MQGPLHTAYLWACWGFFRWVNRCPSSHGKVKHPSVPSPADVVPSAAPFATDKKFSRAWKCGSIFFVVFLFVGVGRGAQATQSFADVLKVPSQPSDSSCFVFVSNVDFSSGAASPRNFTCRLRICRSDSCINPSRSSTQRSAGQRNPGGLWPLTPVNPAPTFSVAPSAGARPCTIPPRIQTNITQ